MLPPGWIWLSLITTAEAAMLLFSLSECLLFESLKETGGLTRLGLGGRLGLRAEVAWQFWGYFASLSSPSSSASCSWSCDLLCSGGCKSDKSIDLLELWLWWCLWLRWELEPREPREPIDSREPLELRGVLEPLLEVRRLVVLDLVCLLSQSLCLWPKLCREEEECSLELPPDLSRCLCADLSNIKKYVETDS